MTGKEKCRYLRELRIKAAKINGIDLHIHDCNNEEECSGTCTLCDEELAFLTNEIRRKMDMLSLELEIELESSYENSKKHELVAEIYRNRFFHSPIEIKGCFREPDE